MLTQRMSIPKYLLTSWFSCLGTLGLSILNSTNALALDHVFSPNQVLTSQNGALAQVLSPILSSIPPHLSNEVSVDTIDNSQSDYIDHASHIILDADGILELGDRIAFQDGSLYDEYELLGTAGQHISIRLESFDFDPFLVLIDPHGIIIAQNDDSSPDDVNSFLELVLPHDGLYKVVANGFDRQSRGQYRLQISTPTIESNLANPEAE